MSHEISNKIHEALGGDQFIDKTGAKDFKTKGNDLQFRIPTKNKINMVKIEVQDDGKFLIKFFNYQPYRHIFDKLKEVTDLDLSEVKGVFADATGLKV